MSHAIPLPVIQTLKSNRCNSNVFEAHTKLVHGNCMRIFGEEQLLPADEAEVSFCGHTCHAGAFIDPNTADQSVKPLISSKACRVKDCQATKG